MGGDGYVMKITGLGELEKKLKRLSDVARDDAKQEALYASSVVVQGDATLNAPVDTGNLRSSIDYEVGTDNADIFTPVEYAMKVEFNQPYLRPALDNNRGNIVKLFADIYAKHLKK